MNSPGLYARVKGNDEEERLLGKATTNCYGLHLGRMIWKTLEKDVAQLVEHRTITPLTQVQFPGAARDFLPRANFQCRLSFSGRTPPCTIACINICAHNKDAVVSVRVWWIMATYTNRSSTNHSDKITNSMIVVAQ